MNYNQQKTLTPEQTEQVLRVERLRNYYEGKTKKWFIPKLLPNGNTIDDNVNIRLARKVVNKGNNFLFGKGLTWQLQKKNATREETTLLDIWGNQETQNSFLIELGIQGGITGNFCIQITNLDKIGFKHIDPTWVFPKYDNDFIEFDIRWFKKEDAYRLLHTKQTNTWDYVRQKYNGSQWIDDTPVAIWPYEWPFIIWGKNLPNPNSIYGLSDLEDIDLVDAINLVSSNMNRIIRMYANPIVWGYGFGSESLSLDTSKLITSTTETSKMQALELAKDLTSPQEYLKYLRTMLAETTAVPESDPDRMRVGAQSGFALSVLFNDLLLKTGIKRNLYGKELITLNSRLLELAGLGKDIQTTLHWPSPLPVDIISQTTADKFDLEAGLVSKQTISNKRGYDYDQEKEYMSEEQTNTTSIGENLIKAFRGGNA